MSAVINCLTCRMLNVYQCFKKNVDVVFKIFMESSMLHNLNMKKTIEVYRASKNRESPL
jgi:hypothetical protein